MMGQVNIIFLFASTFGVHKYQTRNTENCTSCGKWIAADHTMLLSFGVSGAYSGNCDNAV